MDELFLKLVSKSHNETAPEVDVADKVMMIIRDGREVQAVDEYDRPFVWMAGFSAAAAIAVGTLAILAYYAWANPLIEISETIAWAAQ